MSPKKKALKLHRQFAHPPAHRLKKLVQDSGNKDGELFDEIERVSKVCKVCLEYKKKPPPRPIVGFSMATSFGECLWEMEEKIENMAKLSEQYGVLYGLFVKLLFTYIVVLYMV